ncbi:MULTISPECIES: SRPBCC family protein [Shewanella]|uniref:SRPBCC family protein n=1 Tax=Shewanella marisflavi TaxID=260364 RepID=A0ABX5WPU1_9GAMM|nr:MULTISPECIES: SRPBCC family protein [Shewanella]MCL1040329.1 SRPBCC family protein [Shewanella marisflavi]QDF76432.1 SRPBCC family protein [Shewanella marisflavi]
MLKKLLILVLLLLSSPFIAALFIEEDYHVNTHIVIDKPKDQVFNFLRMLKNQDQFSVWAKMDSAMEQYYRGEDGTVGFVSGWRSDNPDVGSGEQEIKAIFPGKRIEYELRFKTPFEAVSPAYITTEALGPNQTEVHWGFSGHMAYPMNILLPLMQVDAMVERDLSQGLDNLKTLLEAN